MSPVARSTLAALAAFLVSGAVAQKFPQTPLADKRFEYDQLPYRIDTDVGLERGEQYGYNICNSTTEGPTSRCQTAMINSIEDFCLWGPPEPNSEVGSTEGEAVAYCTKPGRGTRLIPRGALTGVQFMKTPDYVQVVGFIDQTQIDMKGDDYGGEMDPHGADLRGNPMGGILFSNAWSGDANKYQQAIEWHNFMGANFFCLKACDPKGPNAAKFCEHIYDRIGCAYNAPNAAKDGVFESCLGDNQDFPGIYTQNGQVMTYTQPPEELGVISTMPYQPKVPASSACTSFESASLYAGLATVVPSGSGPAASAKPTGAPSGASGSGKPTGTGASSGRPTGSSSGTAAGSQSTDNGALAMGVSGLSVMSVILSALFLS